MTDLRVRARFVAVAATLLTAVPLTAYAAAGDDLPFAGAVFRATHNSYSGDIAGARGSITEQLDAGVRFLEYDVWSGDHASAGDYRIGHSKAGDQVDHTGGNPAGDQLRAWLTVVNDWSAGHPAAAPITVLLDLKDDLTARTSYQNGNLAALNDEIGDVFGGRLVRGLDTPAGLGPIGSLRGRVVTVLSGSATARAGYRRDTGSNPAVAINARGQVVEVHDNGAGVLWYWTGVHGADGSLTWRRHGRYDTGKTPAVALNNDGTVVEVHQAPTGNALWSRVGRLDDAGEITWSASAKYDTGVLPTIAFPDLAGSAVREIHRSQNGSQNWDWTGTAGATAVAWGAHATTADPRFPTTTATVDGHSVTVAAAGSLTAATDRVAAGPIRLPQLAFVEYQSGDAALLKDGAVFWAATASNKSFMVAGRQAGVSVRGWDFDAAGLATVPLANFPATNTPAAAWYRTLLEDAVA
ncbi:PI-PLC domain-containing protein [Actinoplanes awajinensis]|uniref:Uncharacterized protein n=1 Tax=Actinoplanes awajinensis subsp. mycoplanecinus TaxID=135947 RepID=A0A117MRL0_9ACTN|nr:hypothetical protein [Actinoplanes awajinensis]KUL31960.1 hypothetical protein ADL15_20860 [Actinoplanes awajinensis subsp. mycoplanecinus]